MKVKESINENIKRVILGQNVLENRQINFKKCKYYGVEL